MREYIKEVVLSGGQVLRVRGDFDPAVLPKLVETLESSRWRASSSDDSSESCLYETGRREAATRRRGRI